MNSFYTIVRVTLTKKTYISKEQQTTVPTSIRL